MGRRQDRVLDLASAIDERRARVESGVLTELGLDGLGLALGVLACTAFPAVAQGLHADPAVLTELARTGHAKTRERPVLERLLSTRLDPVRGDEAAFSRESSAGSRGQRKFASLFASSSRVRWEEPMSTSRQRSSPPSQM